MTLEKMADVLAREQHAVMRIDALARLFETASRARAPRVQRYALREMGRYNALWITGRREWEEWSTMQPVTLSPAQDTETDALLRDDARVDAALDALESQAQ